MLITGPGDIAAEIEALGSWAKEDAAGWLRLLEPDALTAQDRAALYDLAETRGWTVDPPRNAGAALWPYLSPAQRALGLGGLFRGAKAGVVAGVALAGVEVISVWRQGLRLRSYVLRREDLATSPLGEAAVAEAAVPLVELQFRYRFGPAGLVAGEARVLYPKANGTGYLVDPDAVAVDAWDYLGQQSIDAGVERREGAASRAGYLLGAGARALGGHQDPGPPIRLLLGLLAQANGGYDLAVAYREYDDPTLRVAIESVVVDEGLAWLDGDLGGASPRQLAVGELAEPATDEGGWTAWPA